MKYVYVSRLSNGRLGTRILVSWSQSRAFPPGPEPISATHPPDPFMDLRPAENPENRSGPTVLRGQAGDHHGDMISGAPDISIHFLPLFHLLR